jgi:hypothetical protein
MPPPPQAFELQHCDFEASTDALQRAPAYTFTKETTQEDILYISHFLLHILIPPDS